MPHLFDYDDDGEVMNLAGTRNCSNIQAALHQQLVTQFSYPKEWLLGRKAAFVKGQLKRDQHMGFFPYD
jgi:hypothetical protein